MNEPPVCARCDEEYGLRAGMDPSKYCDECAQILIDELEPRCERVVWTRPTLFLRLMKFSGTHRYK